MEENNKSTVYKSIIIGLIILVLLVSLSYGFWTLVINNNGTNIGGRGTDRFDIDLITENDGYINASDLVSIEPANIESQSEKGYFKVQTGNNQNMVNYTLSLIDLNVSTNLRVPAFKWALIDLNDNTTVAQGTFHNVSGSQMTIRENVPIAANTTDDYEFRIWIESDGSNQVGMLNGTFSGRFSIVSSMVYDS